MSSELKILLVDDFKSTRNLERSMLNAIGYSNVIDAVDGEDAITKLQEEDGINFIISDWNMPNKSGYDLLVWVRASDQFKQIPFIMATAQSEKKRNDQSLEGRCDQLYPKTF